VALRYPQALPELTQERPLNLTADRSTGRARTPDRRIHVPACILPGNTSNDQGAPGGEPIPLLLATTIAPTRRESSSREKVLAAQKYQCQGLGPRNRTRVARTHRSNRRLGLATRVARSVEGSRGSRPAPRRRPVRARPGRASASGRGRPRRPAGSPLARTIAQRQ